MLLRGRCTYDNQQHGICYLLLAAHLQHRAETRGPRSCVIVNMKQRKRGLNWASLEECQSSQASGTCRAWQCAVACATSGLFVWSAPTHQPMRKATANRHTLSAGQVLKRVSLDLVTGNNVPGYVYPNKQHATSKTTNQTKVCFGSSSSEAHNLHIIAGLPDCAGRLCWVSGLLCCLNSGLHHPNLNQITLHYYLSPVWFHVEWSYSASPHRCVTLRQL
jgi:hypothetical protein